MNRCFYTPFVLKEMTNDDYRVLIGEVLPEIKTTKSLKAILEIIKVLISRKEVT